MGREGGGGTKIPKIGIWGFCPLYVIRIDCKILTFCLLLQCQYSDYFPGLLIKSANKSFYGCCSFKIILYSSKHY